MPTDFEGLLDRIREQVAERRRAGAYPPGLEEDLESELAGIIARRPSHEPAPPISAVLDRLSRPPGVDPGRVAAATDSGIPGGAALHRAVALAAGHQVAAVLSQVQDIANATWEDVGILAEAIVALDRRILDIRDRGALVDSLVDRVASYERSPSGSAAGLAGLLRRLERLEAAEAARNARPWFAAEPDGAGPPSAGLEALTEGLEEPVLVLGPASPGGLPSGNEAIAGLGSVTDRALGALVAAGLVERLAPQELLDLVRLAADKLRIGGLLVADATNPRCVWGLANGSASRPDRVLVDPGWLALCAREAGFATVDIAWGPLPPGVGPPPAGEGTEASVHRALFQPVSYRLSARR